MSTRTRTTGSLSYSGKIMVEATSPGYIYAKGTNDAPNTRFIPYTNYGGGGLYGVPLSNLSTISDVVGRRKAFNPCSHSKHYSIPVHLRAYLTRVKEAETVWEADRYHYAPAVPGEFEIKIDGSIHPSFFYGSNPESLPTMDAIDWGKMVSEVGNQVSGAMQSRSNLIVSAVEVGKTIQMLRNPFNLIKSAKKLNIPKKATLKDLTKRSASAWLEWRYGWSNLVADTVAIASVMDEAAAHREYLLKYVGKDRPIHSREIVEKTVDVPYHTSTFLSYMPLVEMVPRNLRVKRTAVFGCAVLNESYSNVFDFPALIKQRLGINRIAEAVWDLVPFSFVVDWFVNVQKIMGIDPTLWARHDIRYLGYSIKTETSIDIDFRCSFPAWDWIPEVVRTCSVQGSVCNVAYARSEGFPPGCDTLGVFGNLRKINVADGAALIVQRIL